VVQKAAAVSASLGLPSSPALRELEEMAVR
jgi:hypothetical protein